ncbi:hypothetical protein DNL40_02835 [Xylanimonas oleitrophica]|uniref:Xylulokinase n=1 Tax=Xylanimonas oleitrophica TaxID=2607479 RepID=A0A2W5Y9I0_9MICO|nr:FGGY family carbohydrate kinase [Xylanimonas oleitrophica]PZR55324.1 hypothetical protein DNL40_02835 [Xylanimonas oleitrophica]
MTGAGGALGLGIDLGTTSVKVLLLDEVGSTVASASHHHGIDPTSSGVQADPERWWDSLRTALAALAAEADLARVAAVGLSGNMSAVVLVDDQVRPVAPALLLADQRGTDEITALDPPLRRDLAARTGNEPQAVFSLSSLLWWQARDLDVLRSAQHYLSAKDFLRARLTGEVATDPTDAYNSLLLRPGTWEWDEGTIQALGLPRRIFPPVLPSTALGGRTTRTAARETGIPAGVPVAVGAGDMAAALAGTAGLDAGDAAVSLGTSATVMAVLGAGARPDVGPRATGTVTYHPTADGSWFALGSLLTGGLVVNWLRSTVGADAIAQAPADPDADDPLMFMPYLAGTGSPDFDSAATGTLLGVTPTTTPPRLVAAALEAVAFDVARLLDLLADGPAGGYRRVVLSGGGSRIGAWPQIIADVTRLPVHVLDEPDLSAVGAAVLGWAAAGVYVAPPAAGTEIAPRAATAAAWDRRRARYERLRGQALALGRQTASGPSRP